MLTFDIDNVTQKIRIYFQHYLKNNVVKMHTKLDDLGFESIDYIELSTFIFETTGQWLDISKFNKESRISDISSYLQNIPLEKPQHKIMAKLDNWDRYVYSSQLKDEHSIDITYIVVCLCLKEDIDIPKLKLAITQTQNNNYLLNCKLIRVVDDYYLERTPIQSELTFKGSILFPRKDLVKLKIRVQSNRLVNIFIQRKKKHYYLIITFHHIALDGWSSIIVQEEIFRRYAGLGGIKTKTASEDIRALNKKYSASLNVQSNTDELVSLLQSIEPREYNQLGHLFQGKLQTNYHCFVIKKETMDHYARDNNINNFPYSVILTFMFHQMINRLAGVDKLTIYTTLSNRCLPISGIKELVTNLATGLPLFLSSRNSSSIQFAEKINDALKIYFKHMSYGAITRVLLENNTLLNTCISPSRQPYRLTHTYINNPSHIIYGNDSITRNYINWSKSRTHINIENDMRIFLFIHNSGPEFVIELHSRVKIGVHDMMVDFIKLNFSDCLDILS